MTVVLFIIGIGVVLLNQHFQKNLSDQKLKQQTLRNIHQKDLLLSSIHAQEDERKRISQDLHDELGAVISIMRMHLLVLEQKNAGKEDELLTELQHVRRLSETALASVRNISYQLMPPQLEAFGLIPTLESMISQINKTAEINIEIDSSLAMTDLTWINTLGLYRIVMELINNTLKHAVAKHIRIDLFQQGQLIKCQYFDDGKGLPEKNTRTGLGQKGIEGRVTALGGLLEWGNRASGGFYANIQLPMNL